MLCACGCGEEIVPKRHHKWFPPKYKHGHWAKISSPWKGSNHWSYNGGIRYHYGYKQIRIPRHPFADKQGYVREHRFIWETYNKATLLPWADCHHKNKKITDNRIENLVAMTKGQHSRHHRLNH